MAAFDKMPAELRRRISEAPGEINLKEQWWKFRHRARDISKPDLRSVDDQWHEFVLKAIR